MSLFSRAHDILAAKADKALDSVENPDETLDYSYEQMLDYITRVRQALVALAAERKRLELQEPQLRQTIAHLGDQAQAALGQGREDLAREALSRQAAAQQQVSHFRNQKEVMKADYAVAQAGDYGGTGDALLRAQDKIATMQARAGATEELLQSGVLEDLGGHTADIQEELEAAARKADVDSQLAALKAQLAATPELPPGDPGDAGDAPAASPAEDEDKDEGKEA